MDLTAFLRILAATTRCVFAAVVCAGAAALAAAADPPPDIRVGIIGLDTSHVIAFTSQLNADDPLPELAGCRVTAAYPKGSPDIVSSVERVPKYTEEVQRLGVTIVDSIDELLQQVDAVLLETNDGRPHFEQALPVIKARKPMFIDKPMAASLSDVMAIFAAAKAYDARVFSTSALRFGIQTRAVEHGSVGPVLGCDTTSPCGLEPTHLDLAWYGIHGVEALVAVMGTGCESVSRVSTAGSDVAVGRWRDGRIGVYRGMRVGAPQYGGMAYGTTGNAPVGDYAGYEPLLIEIVKFFRGGPAPVTEEETVEVFAFMEAADKSKRLGGEPALIEPIIAEAREAAFQRFPGRE